MHTPVNNSFKYRKPTFHKDVFKFSFLSRKIIDWNFCQANPVNRDPFGHFRQKHDYLNVHLQCCDFYA